MRLKLVMAVYIFAGSSVFVSAQTDVALSLYGAFSGRTDAAGVTVSPANSAGGMVEVRHIKNPILGFEGTYSFNRANQRYTSTIAVTCPIGMPNCSPPSANVEANAHEITFDWVPSVKVANFRPFGVLGVGALFNVPKSGQTSVETQTDTSAVYLYGAGLDWGLLPHLGLRFQYRGNLYKTPDVTQLFTSIDKFRHTAEPMIGIYFRL
jgi:opacity protein-like surface antigen